MINYCRRRLRVGLYKRNVTQLHRARIRFKCNVNYKSGAEWRFFSKAPVAPAHVSSHRTIKRASRRSAENGI